MGDAAEPRDPVSDVRAAVLASLHEQPGVSVFERVCRACLTLLPVDGASVSVMTDTARREVLFASDELSARIEAVQFSLGEGPCFEAFESGRAVLIPDLPDSSTKSWPIFAAEITGLPIGAIFAFPLQRGAIRIGAMDLYRREPGWLSPTDLAVALQFVDLLTWVLLNTQTDMVEGEQWAALSGEREQVHQATGMLIAALNIPAAQALVRLRGYAFATGRLVDDVARDIVARRLSPFDLDK